MFIRGSERFSYLNRVTCCLDVCGLGGWETYPNGNTHFATNASPKCGMNEVLLICLHVF